MTINNIAEQIIPVLHKYAVKRAGLFGSVATQRSQTESSDIDILVELSKPISLIDFLVIKLELEDKLGKKVDLVEYQSIKPLLRQRILSEEIRIYG